MRRIATAWMLGISFVFTGCLGGGGGSSGDPGSGGGGWSGNAAPRIAGTPPSEVVPHDQYSFSPQVSDPEGDPLAFDIVGKPDWAHFNEKNGRLHGVPRKHDVGIYTNIRITVSDGTTAAARTLGAARDFDLGLVRITPDGKYPIVPPHTPTDLPQNQVYLAFTHPRKVQESIDDIEDRFEGRESMLVEYPVGEQRALGEALEILRDQKWNS